MPTWYVTQQIGVADGTKTPPDRPDGRVIGAKVSSFACTKKAGEAWASGDKVFLCSLKAGEALREVLATAGASLGSATVSIGTLAVANKYVDAKTLTAIDIPTALGPNIASLTAGPLTANEDLYMTIGAAAVPGATTLNLDLRISSIK